MTLRPWLPTLVWGAVILALTSVPTPPPLPGGGTDKVLHAAVYGVFGALALRAAWTRQTSARSLLACILAAVVFAALDEWHQSLVPGRAPELLDWLADVIGATVGATLAAIHRINRVTRT